MLKVTDKSKLSVAKILPDNGAGSRRHAEGQAKRAAVSEQPLTIAVFQTPPAEARVMPFWFWNGRMDEETIHKQVRSMAQAGVGGFFIHPRQGLEAPYLSNDWFDRVRLAVAEARACGMKVWLYDEFPYPSGMAGGQLTADYPEFRARVLEHAVFDAQGGVPVREEFPMGRVVGALACPVKGDKVRWDEAQDIRRCFGSLLTRELFWLWSLENCPHSRKRFMADEARKVLQWTPPAGEWRLFVALEMEQRGFKYYDYYFDPLRPGAAEAFIRLTHARYAEAVGNEFGRTITGIFTDETEPPEWSPEIEMELSHHFGFDLPALFPALRHDDHPLASEVRYRFRQCALRLFEERWEAPISRWCREWGLVWGGERPIWRPAQFGNLDQPSVDAGHRRAGDEAEPLRADLRSNARAAMAAAEHAGGSIVRCECFHSMGWGATLQDQKWQIDWMSAQGVNRFTPHAFYASMNGLRKHDAAPSFFLGTPAWENYRLLADYAARLGLALSAGQEMAHIAVLHPTVSLWIGGGLAAEVRSEYEWLMNHLMAEHRMFHPVDARAIAGARMDADGLRLGRACYRMVLAPSFTTADRDTEKAITAACKAGIPVLMAAPLADKDVDGTSLKELAGRSGVIRISKREQWMPEIERRLPRELSIARQSGGEAGQVWMTWRRAGSQQILFLANTVGTVQPVTIRFLKGESVSWDEWSLEDGRVKPVSQDGEGNVVLELVPYGSALLVSRQTAGRASALVKNPPACILPDDDGWQIRTEQANALRLNRWQLSDFDNGKNGNSICVEAHPLHYFDKSAGQWRWSSAPNGGKAVHYTRRVVCKFVPADLRLLIEDGAIRGKWSLAINGQPVAAERFSPADFLGGNKEACPVALYFREGENSIELHLEDAFETGGLCAPLHLIGSFGLAGPGRRELDRPPVHGSFMDFAGAGLPHFSGTAVFFRRMKFPPVKESRSVELPAGFEDITELIVNGYSLGVRAWAPYRWELPSISEEEAHVELRVTNTLLPFFEGQQWDGNARVLRNV